MGIVDVARARLESLKDTTMPQRVVFHHVPKCGGTSVGRALRKRYFLSQTTVKPEQSFRAFEAFTGRDDREQMLTDVLDLREQMLLYHLFDDVRCLSLHVRFSEVAFARFHPRYKFVTVLRNPVDRFISNYFWSFGRTGAFGRIDEELGPFLLTDRAKRMGATFSEYFSGLPADTDFTGEAAIVAAIGNLQRLDVLGRLDDLDRFVGDLRSTLGVRLRVGHENRAGQLRPQNRQVITDDMRARIAALCAPDLAIWTALFGAPK